MHNMLVFTLKLIFWFLLLSLQLSAILSRKENGGNNGIVIPLHRMRSRERFVPVEAGSNHDDQEYQRLAKMVQASKALKRGMDMKSISEEGSLFAFSDFLEYYIKLWVGTPPQDLLLVMDTGSDVVWLPCTRKYACSTDCPQHSRVFLRGKSSSAVTVNCADPKCKEALAEGGDGRSHNCTGSRACSKYKIYYGTGNATGRLLSETLTLALEDGGSREIKHFAVGCSVVSSIFTGIAGFGRGGLSMPSQLSHLLGNKFAYCLNFQDNSSRIVLGDMAVPKDIPLNYTPFLINSRSTFAGYRNHYYIDLIGISIGGKRLKLPSKLLRFDSNGNGGTIIDSGASYTAFPEAIYNQIAGEFASQIGHRRARLTKAVTGNRLCYNVSGVENFQVPKFAFHFKGGSDMVLPALNSFIKFSSDIACLAMKIKASNDGPALSLGNHQQQNFHILYDRDKNRLGFTRKTCETVG